jgi:DHA1 family multidrug resistance protein-like MFS transporter
VVGADERRGVLSLLVSHGLMSAGFTMLIPLISVHFTTAYGMSGATVGGILAVRQITQQGLMVFGGALGDRIGHKPLICGGYLVRALGFLLFAVATDVPGLIAAAVVTALGGTFFEATAKAALATMVPAERRAEVFSLAGLVGGVGLAVGPLLGVALLRTSFFLVGTAAAACFFLAFALGVYLLPPLAPEPTSSSALDLRGTLATVVRDRRFVWFTCLQSGYWFLVNQIYISVPLLVLRLTGASDLVGAAFAIQAVVAICLQVPLVRLLSRLLSPARGMALGLLLMGAGLASLGLARAEAAVLAGVLVYAVGRVAFEPIRDALTAKLAPPSARAAYFGFGFLALAFGGSLGNYVGGWLMDLAAAPALALLPWLVFGGVGVLSAAAFARFRY